ncbi:MAG: glycosyltransferase [Chthoniobacterales bacterium]
MAALQELAKTGQGRVIPVQIAGATATYEWSADGRRCDGLLTLCEGIEEAASPLDVFLKARKLFRDERVEVAFLPSYSPARYFALFAAAKSLGIRTVMMNESHAGTEQATGWRRWIKRQIVKRFDAALVGGEPHKRHFASLGIPAEKIFTGYDAVDNALFAARADEVRSMEHGAWSVGQEQPEAAHLSILISQPSTEQSLRSAYGLPERYFLSLGRMVEKKNLATLVSAYAKFCDGWRVTSDGRGPGGVASPPQAEETGDRKQSEAVTRDKLPATRNCIPALVFVGSGELEGALREQARGLGLRVIDRTNWKTEQNSHGLSRISTDGSERLAADRTKGNAASSVIAYGPSTASGPPVRAGCEGPQSQAENCRPNTESSVESDRGAVYFYGFRQIEENPVFYALAEAFVLPSLKEEWGLVVNEAMACSLPVIVSRTAGCAEDLLPGSGQVAGGEWRVTSKDADDRKPLTDDSLEERSNGFVFDPKSSDALSEALQRVAVAGERLKVIGNNLEERGKRSREIVAKFSCENFARQALRAADAARPRAK